MVRRSMAFLVVLVGASLCSVCLVVWAGGPDDEPAVLKFKPVAPIPSLMQAQAEHFTAIMDYIATTDEKDPKRFEKMAHQAYILAELGNVNQFNKSYANWRGWAKAIRDEAKILAEAAQKENQAAVRAAAKLINNTCKSCHDVYQ